MTNTPNIGMPLMEAAQSQKHVTHNQSLQVLDALVQLAVVNRITTSPPGSPSNGDRYIIASVATGIWAGKETQIASYENGGWVYYLPTEGWFAWDKGANEAIIFNTTWNSLSGGSTVSDAAFALTDDIDPTKVAKFQLSGITTGTTRTFTVPNVNATLAHLGTDAQTFAGALTFSNGTLSLSNGTSNLILWGTAGVGAPAFTTRSPGTKLVLYPLIGPAATDYALGIESGAMWSSIPFANSSTSFRWYAATTLVATLRGDGAFLTSWLGLGGAVPDATNRFSINTPAVLLNNAGTSINMVFNKNAAANDATMTFQTGFSTRAIIGTTGSDDFVLKVSPDGSSFFDGLTIIRSTGKVRADLALNINPRTGDLASPVDGDLWYNSTTAKFRARQGGSSVDVIGGGGGGSVLSGTATITITGSEGRFEWEETITAVGVTGSSRVQLWLAPNDDTLENSPEMLDLVLISGTPGTGTIAVIATFAQLTTGPINLIWSAI